MMSQFESGAFYPYGKRGGTQGLRVRGLRLEIPLVRVSCLAVNQRYAAGLMELRHLRYFVGVAEAENVSRAALKLHVSQPGLSRQIRDLESELGFFLFERTAKSVRLTDAGKIFLKEAKEILQQVENATARARAASNTQRSEIHVGYAPSPTVRILPPTLRLFQMEFPNVQLKLHDLSTQEMLAGIREKTLHVAFMVQPNHSMLRGLTYQQLLLDPMCVAVPPNHPMARLRSVAIAEVGKSPLIVLSKKEYPEYHEYLDILFAGSAQKPQIASEHDSAASMIASIEAGCGVAITPRSMACVVGPRLKLIPLKPAPEPLSIGAVWAKGGLSVAAERLLAAAQESAGKLAAV
jgi:DNA-binding transcriptional LysR family regulator